MSKDGKEKHPLRGQYYGPRRVARIKDGPGHYGLTIEELDGTEVSGEFKDWDDKWNFRSSITSNYRRPDKFEYITRLNLTENDLNEYGELGWELVSVQPVMDNKEGQWKHANKFWLKRKVTW